MKRALLLLTLVFLLTSVVLADGPEVPWSVVAGGGSTSASDGLYSLGATVGQGATGVAGDGLYTLQAGFWHTRAAFAPPPPRYAIYLPLVLRER